MPLAESALPVFQRGDWPGKRRFRRGWARAEARRWNDVIPDANLRLLRGGSGFLTACTEKLREFGAPSVLSPPLPVSGRRTWRTAGYEEFVELALMRLDLESGPATPDHLVVETQDPDLDDLLEVDRSSFADFWRFDHNGLSEAIAATGKSKSFIVRGGDGPPIAYVIVGYGHAIAYLQRLAVHPEWQGNGMGRSLVRVAARSARASGARAMLLNTQFDNKAALGLYEAEGFVILPERLAVLRSQ